MSKFNEFILTLHGYSAILASVLLVVMLIYTVVLFLTKNDINFSFRKVSLYMLIMFHIQLILGVIVLFSSQKQLLSHLSYKIQGKMSLMEHLPANFLAILLVTLFYSKVKRSVKVSGSLVFFITLALVLVARSFILFTGVFN